MHNSSPYSTLSTTIDIVLCIDGTISMGNANTHGISSLDQVKQHAINIYKDVCTAYNAKHPWEVTQLRVRVVLFRDYIADGENAMMATDFYILPQQTHEYEKCINSIRAEGGGDIPEDGLEALAYAIKSKWTTHGDRKRQIIIVWSDAPTHALGFNSRSKCYPKGMPKDMDELSNWWDDPSLMKQHEKRLAIFAPDDGNWKYISDNWDLTMHIPTDTNAPLSSGTYEMVINALV